MGDLLNLIGLSMGIALYAMLLAMVIRTGRTRPDRAGIDPLLLSTAILGLTWNVCALPVYELLKIGMTGPFRLFTAIGFSALPPTVPADSATTSAIPPSRARWLT